MLAARALAAGAIGVPLLALTVHGAARDGRMPSVPLERCTARETSRDTLRVNGRDLYVEPVALAPSGSEVLLAGRPNYLWLRDSTGATVADTRDSLFGAIIGPGRSARAVESPVDPRLVFGVRASGRPEGGWDVVFAEAREVVPYHEPAEVARLWHGVHDGMRWRELRSVDAPPGAALRAHMGSALVRRGDALAWAMPAETPAPESRTHTALFQFRDGRWSHEIVPTFRTAYAEPWFPAERELELLVVRLYIEAFGQAGGDEANTLYRFARNAGEWRWQRLQSGNGAPIHDPSLARSAAGTVVTWKVVRRGAASPGYEARALVGVETVGLLHEPIVVDPSAIHVAPAMSPGGPPLWVTAHVSASDVPRDPRVPGPMGEVRVVTAARDSAEVLLSMPSPFTGNFAAASTSPGGLLIAGPLFGGPDRLPVVTTLLIDVAVRCGCEPNDLPGDRASRRETSRDLHPTSSALRCE